MKKSILILALSFVALSCKKDYLCTTTTTIHHKDISTGEIINTTTNSSSVKMHGLTTDDKNNVEEAYTNTTSTPLADSETITICVVD
jgi:hypothetical protein